MWGQLGGRKEVGQLQRGGVNSASPKESADFLSCQLREFKKKRQLVMGSQPARYMKRKIIRWDLRDL